jgi:hypothetical protein
MSWDYDQSIDIGTGTENTKTKAAICEDSAARGVDQIFRESLRSENYFDKFFGDVL